MKKAGPGRYVDTLTGDGMRRDPRAASRAGLGRKQINREQTAIITMFNKLVERRRSGEIPRNVVVPEVNPGKGVKKVNEDRFILNRRLTDAEDQALRAVAESGRVALFWPRWACRCASRT